MKFNALIPELRVQDIDRTKHFYLDVLACKIEYERIILEYLGEKR